MTQHFKTSTEEKIQWLHAHRDLWFGVNLTYSTVEGHAHYLALFRAMQAAGLYSATTAAHDAYLVKLVGKVPLRSSSSSVTSHKEKKRYGRK